MRGITEDVAMEERQEATSQAVTPTKKGLCFIPEEWYASSPETGSGGGTPEPKIRHVDGEAGKGGVECRN